MSKAEKLESKATELNSPKEIKKAKWEPLLEDINEFKQKIIRAYQSSRGVYDLKNVKKKPKLPSEQFLDQYARIAVFLQEKGQFIKQLIKLNNLLLEESKKDSESTSQLLRTTLEKELAKFGFQPRMGKVHKFLMPSMFRETLRYGLLLKDPGLRETLHGDFTHAIQWLMIAWQHQESQFLGGKDDDNKLVINIYKSLGQDDTVFDSGEQDLVGLPKYEKTIWEMVVDQLPQTYKSERPLTQKNKWETDPGCFRSPDNLHLFLLNNIIPEISFLKTIIVKKDEKRKKESKLTKLEQKLLINSDFLNSKSSRYSFYSPYPVQLPIKELQDEKSSLQNLELKTDLSEEKIESSQEKMENHYQIFLEATELFKSKKYLTAIKLFLYIEKFYAQNFPSSPVFQQLLYNLGNCYKYHNIKLADYYFRKAFHVSLTISENEYQENPIPLFKVMREMAKTQHMLRVKAETERQEAPASCLIC